MADFLDKLSDALQARRDELAAHLRTDANPGEEPLQRLVRAQWFPLPSPMPPADWSAYAIDGSVSEVDLDSGSFVIIVQSLCLGDRGHEESSADLEILPAVTPRPTASRIADLLQALHELRMACATVGRIAPGSVLFLDGALYGRLPQLYPLAIDESGLHDDLPDRVLGHYLELLGTARAREVRLVAVSKTSREATHCKLWLRAADQDPALTRTRTDSEMIHRWTDRRAGVSAPVILGGWGFTGGSRAILDRSDVAASPAIVSFFVRLADHDDALRVDVPAWQAGADACLGDLHGAALEGGVEAVHSAVGALASDYGGLEVYNALLYSVDREVRLKRNVVAQVYLPLIESHLGQRVRLDRSARRFW